LIPVRQLFVQLNDSHNLVAQTSLHHPDLAVGLGLVVLLVFFVRLRIFRRLFRS
jgi:hypothetical protein